MEVKSFEKKEKNTAELTVQASPEEFEAAVNKAYIRNRGRIAIPGFRKGKAPRKIIENMYGAEVFYEEAINIICPDALSYGTEDQNIRAVGQTGVMDFNVEDDKSLVVKFLVSLYPEIELKQYKGISAPKQAVRILKKDIDAEIQRVREQNARIQTVDREAKNGDIVTIDFDGYVDGTAFDGGKAENYDLELGSGSFIPGFEDQLVGVKAGDTPDVNVTFPESYRPPLNGKDAVFKIVVRAVKEKILPDLDDEFAKDVAEFDTLAEYTADVKEHLTERRKATADREFEEAVMQKLVENVEGDIPDAMIDDAINQTIENYSFNLAQQNMNFDQYLSMMGTDLAGFKASMRPSAERQIKSDLALEKIAELENLAITDERVEEEYKNLSEGYGVDIDVVKRTVTEDAIKDQLKADAARDLVISSAVVEKKKAEKKDDSTSEEAE